MKHINIGRLSIGFFPYSVGFSWRLVGGMGRVLDLGFIKFVLWSR